jgi:hypothetical protein
MDPMCFVLFCAFGFGGGGRNLIAWIYHSDKIGSRVCFARGIIAQANNGDELFWKEKSHAVNAKFVSLAFTNDL